MWLCDWYEYSSSVCFFCREKAHVINVYPLLCYPKKEFHVKLLKNPKQNLMFESLLKAKRQENDITMVVEANGVHVKPKNFVRKASDVGSKSGKNNVGFKVVKYVAKGIKLVDSFFPVKIRSFTRIVLGKGKFVLLVFF